MKPTSPQPCRVVVFDLGGVLFDWNPEHLYRRLIPDSEQRRHFLGEICPRDWHALQDGGADPDIATRSLQGKHPEHAEMIAAWYGRFDEMLAPPYPEMSALVERLRSHGIGLHLLSNAPGFMMEWLTQGRLRQRHPFLAAFETVVVSGAENISKPDRRVYELAARRGGFAPAEAVFIDDTLRNVAGARDAGWSAVHHTAPEDTIRALRDLGLPA